MMWVVGSGECRVTSAEVVGGVAVGVGVGEREVSACGLAVVAVAEVSVYGRLVRVGYWQ